MNRKYLLALSIFTFLLLTTAQSFASGSDSDEPETKKADAKSEYQKGVGHMDNAKAILLKGDSAFAYNYRATSDAKAKKEFEKAINSFQEALSHDPTMKEAYNNIGFCYRKIGEFGKSLASYQNALALDKDFAQAREYLGETYLALDSLDRAMEQLDYLKQLKSTQADTLALAIASYKLDKMKK